jgi:hypothetical protein
MFDHPLCYEIKLLGRLNKSWVNTFKGLESNFYRSTDGQPITILRGLIVDQAALRGILCSLWDLNLTLISIVGKRPGSPGDW